MRQRSNHLIRQMRAGLRRLLSGPQVLAFLPALALGAFWTAGEVALLVVALGVPTLVLIAGGFENAPVSPHHARDPITNLPLRDALEDRIDSALRPAPHLDQTNSGMKTTCVLIEIEDYHRFRSRYEADAADAVMLRLAERIRVALRDGDVLSRMGDARFGVALGPVARLDLETGVQLASRLQSAIEEPLSVDGQALYLTCAVGFCLSSRSAKKTGAALVANATLALDEALRNTPSAIRSYSREMSQRQHKRTTLLNDALIALENNQIKPWFQPQISTDTGQVTGFEALARWTHPERGIISPAEFLPVLEDAGQMERLGEVILYQALTAINAWDAAGINVPCVAVNFTGEELRNPKLSEKIRWDLDRFDLSPDRLTIEVLETVVAGSPEDMAAQNITRLAQMGCRVDLDDFGTGHASITAIRRFAIERLKIDRSFITHVDQDAEQQRMVSAILTMAERLGLETLAEGVETAGEHAMLAQLGCRHVQGFGIARPMPFDQTLDWMEGHMAKVGPVPRIGRKSG